MNEKKSTYDLEERTALLGEKTIEFCKKAPENTVVKPLISQLVRSATSVGANYMEANSASSRKDFKHKIHICKKETAETKHWLRMFSTAAPQLNEEARVLWKESQELTLIFGKILSSLKN